MPKQGRRTESRCKAEAGTVTAEAAMVLPVLVLVAAVLAWVVTIGVTQARLVDAARETARALARGDDPATSLGWGRRVAPAGTRFDLHRDRGLVTVTASLRLRGPGGLAAGLGSPWLRASAVTAAEPDR